MRTSLMGCLATAAAAIIVIDGDTVEQNGRRYRLLGFDTPETTNIAGCQFERGRGKAAAEALRDELRRAGTLKLVPTGEDCKWGRWCAHLYVDGVDVAERMIGRGYAVPWRGKRNNWCAWR